MRFEIEHTRVVGVIKAEILRLVHELELHLGKRDPKAPANFKGERWHEAKGFVSLGNPYKLGETLKMIHEAVVTDVVYSGWVGKGWKVAPPDRSCALWVHREVLPSGVGVRASIHRDVVSEILSVDWIVVGDPE